MATWINVTPSLKRAANIINGLDTSKFPLLLSRISQSLQAGAINEKAFNNEEEEKLEVSLGLEKSDLKLLLESTTFILEQAAYYMTKPAVLQRYLSDTLELNEDKCEAFVNVWINSAKGIVEHLRQRSLFPAQPCQVVEGQKTSISRAISALIHWVSTWLEISPCHVRVPCSWLCASRPNFLIGSQDTSPGPT